MSFSGATSFWSRSFEEYRLIFGLTESDLAGLIPGCADGPAGFNAEATALGHRVIACDPDLRIFGQGIRAAGRRKQRVRFHFATRK
jgi:hypothetical protein